MNKLFACLFLLMCMLTINSSIIENPLPANIKENDLQDINRVLISDSIDQNTIASVVPTVLNLNCIVTDINGGCTAWSSILPGGLINICIINILGLICVISIQIG